MDSRKWWYYNLGVERVTNTVLCYESGISDFNRSLGGPKQGIFLGGWRKLKDYKVN